MGLLTSGYVRVQIPRRDPWTPRIPPGVRISRPVLEGPCVKAGAALDRTTRHDTVRAGVRAVKPDILKYRDWRIGGLSS